MKRINLSLILTFLISSQLLSQNLDYSILTIPDSLKTNANAVIRYENTSIDILSQSRMNVKKEMVVTVLNKFGNGDGYINLYYNNHKKIKSVGARIYNAFGMEIKKIRQSDFKDVSAVGGSTLYSDSRVLYYEHIPVNYPYTIKYEYETSTSNTAFIPDWLPIKHFYASTEKSVFTINYPGDIDIRLKEQNLGAYEIENNSVDNNISYTLKNAKAIENEDLSPSFYLYGPHVKFANNKFQLGGVPGAASNWNEFGKWWYDELLVGRNNISVATKNEILNLVKNVDDTNERIRRVYKYMQEKTRYINVSIGIGGWEPMLASEVDKLGYGDCKALTNYTHALLETIDIPSYYTKIYAGEGERNIMDKDLASQQSNHVILMVPTKKDTIWLECTSQKVPFGYLGKFTDDRDALAVTPEGGKVVHTKSYADNDSKQVITGEYTLMQNGDISAKANIVSSGVQYDNHYGIADLDTKEKDSYYKEFFDNVNNMQIEGIEIKNNDLETTFTERIEFTASNYAVNSGDRMLLRLNAFNVNQNVPKRYRNRKLALEIQYGFLDIDEVIINLPQNYQIDAMATDKDVVSEFGTYAIKIEKINEHQLKYHRELLVKQGLYTVEDYEKYRAFRKKINQLDNSKIVLIKNQTL
ncbi:MAG: DUF3857 domain-containing protein [Flavobacteriaceae bacterium]|nr:DUF3857 domain-containing protein [Flavobacteriaceae bacterium]